MCTTRLLTGAYSLGPSGRWHPQQQGSIESIAQSYGRRDRTAQVGDGRNLADRSAVVSGKSEPGNKHQTYNSAVVAESADAFEKDDGRITRIEQLFSHWLPPLLRAVWHKRVKGTK